MKHSVPRAGLPGQKAADLSLREVACEEVDSWLHPATCWEMFPKSHLVQVLGQGDLRQADVLTSPGEGLNRPEVPAVMIRVHLHAICRSGMPWGTQTV